MVSALSEPLSVLRSNPPSSLLSLSLSLVSVHCKDTRIAVQVRTNKPFNGRIYALGRSETCNIDVINSDAFRLDLTMAGQDCNTQSVVSGQQMRCQGST